MPASITHYIFSKKLIKDEKYQDVISLASQGPDPFFFYGYNLKKRNNIHAVRQFGTLLHHIDIAPVYQAMIEYALDKENEEKDILFSFIKGLMYHYVLDRNGHKYIFYISGFSSEKDKAKKYFLEHCFVESRIDALMKKKHHERKNVMQMIKINDQQLLIISKMFEHIGKNHFKVDYLEEKSYYYALNDMRLVNHILYSPLKIKKLLFMIFLKNHQLNANSLPLCTFHLKKYDLLNEKKEIWKDCVNAEEYNLSFEEILNNAYSEVEVVKNILNDAYLNKPYIDKLQEFINEIDHDGFKINAKKLHFKLKLRKKEF